jgi:nanoRNase/pAp phosphatase (c-di-AMP/oligoRNAs hydrolase)
MEPIAYPDRPQYRQAFQSCSPFGCDADAHLLDQLILLKQLFDRGKHTFVLVTHRDPDADAIAACMGVDRLLRATLPSTVTIRWMHDGCLPSSLREVSGQSTESISNLEQVIEDPSVAIVVVDQPALNLCTILPRSFREDPRFESRKPDLVLDHHGEQKYGDGRVCCPDAGSTSALICRLLDLAHYYNLTSSSLVVDGSDSRLALLLNMGARTDAGISVNGDVPQNASIFTRWVVEQTQAKVNPKDAALFDVLKGQDGRLLATAREHQQVHNDVVFEGIRAKIVISHAGMAHSPHCIGACASELFKEALSRKESVAPLVVVLFGIIRPNGGVESHSLHTGETIHVSIRSEEGISAEKIAQRLSSEGGGRPCAAGFQLHVPGSFDNVDDREFLNHCLNLARIKLTWQDQFSWKLDTE